MTTITTGTSGPQAWKIALVAGAVGLAALVAVNLPQTTSDTTGQQGAQTATATLPESVTGFEYNNESTAGQAASPGVTSQYTGNSGELFPYENGQAPQTVQSQGAARVDPRAAAAAGLNPGAIDAIVGGTTRVAVTPDNLADRQDRATASQTSSAPSFAASDEALVNPVPEVNAAQLIEDIIVSERSAPATRLAGSDDALVSGVGEAPFNSAPYVAYAEGMSDAVAGGASAQAWQAYVDAVNSGSVAALYESNASEPLIDERVNGDPYLGGTSDDVLTTPSSGPNPADVKFLGTSTQSAGTQRSPQQNVSMR